MNSKYKIILLVIVLISALLVGGWIYFRYFFDLLGPCGEEVTSESRSPSKDYMVEELLIDCGATSDYVTEFAVTNIKTNQKQAVLSLKGHHINECDAHWQESSLEISCKGRIERVYQQKKQFEIIPITFYLNGQLEEVDIWR